jgi:hypothetical protein
VRYKKECEYGVSASFQLETQNYSFAVLNNMAGSTRYPFPPNALSLSLSDPSFHPTLHLTLNLTNQITSNDCSPVIGITLPDLLFPDPDELRDRLPLSRQIKRWYLLDYEVDIERPERSHQTENGLILVFEGDASLVDVEIPFHARYLKPGEGALREVDLFSGGYMGSIGGEWVCGETNERLCRCLAVLLAM